jgi:hypothetical protein
MTPRFLITAALVGCVAGLGLGADLKSGLQPGDPVPAFNPLNVTGKAAGQKQCPV